MSRVTAGCISLVGMLACGCSLLSDGGGEPVGPGASLDVGHVTCQGTVDSVRKGLAAVTADRGNPAVKLSRSAGVLNSYRSKAPEDEVPLVDRLFDSLARAGADPAALPRAAQRLSDLSDTCGSVGRVESPAAGKIKHVVVVMQENRSFDHMFGTYPGADGFDPGVCIPNPATGGCTGMHHALPSDYKGGPHTQEASIADIDGGKMDGYIREWNKERKYCHTGDNMSRPTCQGESEAPDVMGYHDRADLPNYWEYADHFVLQDHMFAPNLGWSQPAHLAMVSGWSAVCLSPYKVETCHDSITFNDIDVKWPGQPSYAWTDITYMLHEEGIPWRFYVAPGSVDDCEGTTDEMIHCTPGVPDFQPIGTPEPWNPLPDFTTVRENHQVKNVQFHDRFFEAARTGTLPAVTWVEPGWYDSDHPPEPVSRGQAWVTRVINALMESPDWKSTAVFVAWDDWGGFYDHVKPPSVDEEGYGLRVPGFMVSPWAKRGYVDHQNLSFDAYLKFIEDVFLDGQRLDPYTDGRWDPRPGVREANPKLGDLMKEFDFTQKPQAPVILEENP